MKKFYIFLLKTKARNRIYICNVLILSLVKEKRKISKNSTKFLSYLYSFKFLIIRFNLQ